MYETQSKDNQAARLKNKGYTVIDWRGIREFQGDSWSYAVVEFPKDMPKEDVKEAMDEMGEGGAQKGLRLLEAYKRQGFTLSEGK